MGNVGLTRACVMFNRLSVLGAFVVCLTIVAFLGCSDRPSRVHPPSINASSAGDDAMVAYDTNGDGLISGQELDKVSALKSAMKNLDSNGDKSVSSEEVTERIEAWQKTRIGRMSLSCTVKWRDRPLEGATVTFVPEKFLGEEIKGAIGTTNKNGQAFLSIPDTTPPGVACGLYRVEISTKKDGKELVPAKYNTETILGQEVALDAASMKKGVTYNLK